jgi:hypothetical protein
MNAIERRAEIALKLAELRRLAEKVPAKTREAETG